MGDKILYCERNNEIVAYVIYTRCRRHVFNSGNKNDYYVIFYYTYPEYRGYVYAKILMETLFRLIDDNNDFYECIAINNFASIRAAEKIGLKKEPVYHPGYQGSYFCFRRPRASGKVLYGLRSGTLLLRDPPHQDG